ncbi:MAG: transcriptional regulator [Smithella sp.]
MSETILNQMDDGFLRLPQIIGRPANPDKNIPAIPPIIPVSKTEWYRGIKAGRYPKPYSLGPATSVWSVQDIRDLIKKIKEKN